MARYSKSASKDVKRAMKRRKSGKLKRGKGGTGGSVKSRKQAIAIGLSEARKKGKKVPKRKAAKKKKGRPKVRNLQAAAGASLQARPAGRARRVATTAASDRRRGFPLAAAPHSLERRLPQATVREAGSPPPTWPAPAPCAGGHGERPPHMQLPPTLGQLPSIRNPGLSLEILGHLQVLLQMRQRLASE